jgi:hypothetical protein
MRKVGLDDWLSGLDTNRSLPSRRTIPEAYRDVDPLRIGEVVPGDGTQGGASRSGQCSGNCCLLMPDTTFCISG